MALTRYNIQAALEAMGESDTMIAGHLETRLREPLAWDDSVVEVAATNRFPSPTTIAVDGETMDVTTLDGDTFTISERPDVLPSTPTINPGARVVDVGRMYSDLDMARAQMLINYATDKYLTIIGSNHGVPRPSFRGHALTITDERFREYLKVVMYLQAGPRRGIMRVLDALLPPLVLTADTSAGSPQRLDFGAPVLPFALQRSLVRVDGVIYRILAIDPSREWVDLWHIPGPTWAGAEFGTASDVEVELLTWDVWEEPAVPGKFWIELYSTSSGQPFGATYMQGGEAQTSDSTTQVTVDHTITQVLGVYLAADTERTGTNYWVEGVSSFVGSVISGLTPLPSGSEPVLVDYGAIEPSTAQLLQSISDENQPAGAYWPAYLSDYSAIIGDAVLDIVRALGMIPVVRSLTWSF